MAACSAAAWYKLMTRDMGPYTRCLGKALPPAQPFQLPLPAPAAKQPNFDQVKKDIAKALTASSSAIEGDNVNGKPYYGEQDVQHLRACTLSRLYASHSCLFVPVVCVCVSMCLVNLLGSMLIPALTAGSVWWHPFACLAG